MDADDLAGTEYDTGVHELPRCAFTFRDRRCVLPATHGGSHNVAIDDGSDTVIYTDDVEPNTAPPAWFGGVPVVEVGEEIPEGAAPGTTAALRRDPSTGTVHPVDHNGRPIMFFTCHHCGGGGCERCGYSGKLKTRAQKSLIAALTGRTVWDVVGTCHRCGTERVRLSQPGDVIDVALCIHCRADVGTTLVGKGPEAARQRMTPESFAAEYAARITGDWLRSGPTEPRTCGCVDCR